MTASGACTSTCGTGGRNLAVNARCGLGEPSLPVVSGGLGIVERIPHLDHRPAPPRPRALGPRVPGLEARGLAPRAPGPALRNSPGTPPGCASGPTP